MAKSKKSPSELNEIGKRKSDRRTDKSKEEATASAPVVERRKVKRRRQIDPTTCEREYSDPEIEFMQAMDEYKRASGRMFPTCSEILEVLSKLGYRQVEEVQTIYDPNAQQTAKSEEEIEELEEEIEEEQIV